MLGKCASSGNVALELSERHPHVPEKGNQVELMRNKLGWTLAFFWILLSGAAQGSGSAPYLEYSDLISGPASGGPDNLGAIVTLFGADFGDEQEHASVLLDG